MYLSKVTSQLGNILIGFIFESYNDYRMFVIDGDKINIRKFQKEFAVKIEHIRHATKKEIELIKAYVVNEEQLNIASVQLDELNRHKQTLEHSLKSNMNELLKAVTSAEKTEGYLSLSVLESELNETGYKNLLALYRARLVVFVNENFALRLTDKGTNVSLLATDKNKVASYLNQTTEGVDSLYSMLLALVTGKETSTNDKDTTNHESKEKEVKVLNFIEIQHLLNENGFKAIKMLQESKLLTIHNDGKMDFGPLSQMPMIQDFLNNPKVFVEFVNQPMPDFPPELFSFMPFSIGNLGSIIQEIQSKMKHK